MELNQVKKYFSFESSVFYDDEEVMAYLTEAFILEGETLLMREGMEPANIYFKLLAQLQVLERKAASHHGALARVNYLIGYYLGLFLHPICGDVLAQSYIEQALRLDPDDQKKETYQETLAMIREEL